MAEKTYDTVIDNKYKIGSLIGKQLIATQPIIGHFDFHTSNKIIAFAKGSTIGTVFNYLIEPETSHVFWAFKDRTGRLYYVLHNPDKMTLNAIDKATTKTVKDYIDQAQQDQEKENKGAFAYYFERYGKIVLGAAVGLGILKIWYDGRNKN